MKTTIEITGQISGNHRLLNALNTYQAEYRKLPFYGHVLTFPTRKAARKALWDGYQYLRAAEPEFAKGGMRYSAKTSLSYDASRAVIQYEN
jgi:hypothetical protein